MKHHIKDGDRLIATIETHGQAIVVVHEPQPTEEPKTNLLYPEGLEAVVKDGEIPKSIWCNYNGTKYEYRPQRDYSHLVGKWVMRIGFSNACYTQWKWYKVVSDDNPVTGIAILDCDNSPITCKDTFDDYEAFVAQFDLTDIRDTNPDEVERIIPFDVERWRKGEFVRVQTRDGREVEQLKEFKCVGTPLVALIEGLHTIIGYGIDGSHADDYTRRPEDLMLVVKGEGGVK
jgi:hypothetical protein